MLRPLTTVTLYDRTYTDPADPEAFLEERYGPGWSVPDPFHEWQWALEDASD